MPKKTYFQDNTTYHEWNKVNKKRPLIQPWGLLVITYTYPILMLVNRFCKNIISISSTSHILYKYKGLLINSQNLQLGSCNFARPFITKSKLAQNQEQWSGVCSLETHYDYIPLLCNNPSLNSLIYKNECIIISSSIENS